MFLFFEYVTLFGFKRPGKKNFMGGDGVQLKLELHTLGLASLEWSFSKNIFQEFCLISY